MSQPAASMKLTPAQRRVLCWFAEMNGSMDYWPCTTQLMRRLEEKGLVVSGVFSGRGNFEITRAGRAAIGDLEDEPR